MKLRFLVIVAFMVHVTLSFRQSFLDRTNVASKSYIKPNTLKLFGNKQVTKLAGRKGGKNLSQSANEVASKLIFFTRRFPAKLQSKSDTDSSLQRLIANIKIAFGAPVSTLKSDSKQLALLKNNQRIILFDAVRSVSIVCTLASVGYYLAVKNDKRKALRMEAELQKQLEYKENMYFEAVSKLVADLSAPDVTTGRRSTLNRQLGELDPSGAIRRFLDNGDNSRNITKIRPDLSEIRRKYIKDKEDIAPMTIIRSGDQLNGGLSLLPSSLSVELGADFISDDVLTSSPVVEVPEGINSMQSVDDSLQQTLDTLRATLQRRMSRDMLDKMLAKLKTSVTLVPLEARDNVISVVRGKLADTAYWMAYANNV